MGRKQQQIDAIRQLQGSVSVDHTATETPITRRPIEQIDAEQWPHMSTAELVDQRAYLNNRMVRAQSMGATHIAEQLYRYLRALDEMIADRPDSDQMHLV